MLKGFTALCITVGLVLGQGLCLKAAAAPAYEEFSTDAKACIVLEADTGRILGGHNIEDRLPMASTTKIMTALLALEEPELDQWF